VAFVLRISKLTVTSIRGQNDNTIAELMPAINVRVDQNLWSDLKAQKPHFLSDTAYLNLIISEALVAKSTLVKPSSSHSSLSDREVLPSLNKEIDVDFSFDKEARTYAESIKKAAKESPSGFEAFWKIYQSCPAPALRVKSQSKPKALEEYRKILKDFTAAQLIQAAKNAVDEQISAQSREEWTAALPDAFRWLRDGKYIVMLEDHAPAQVKRLTEEEEQARKDAIAIEAHARIFGR
jgi:hypothetical protein